MSTLEYVYNNHDKSVLGFIFTATIFVGIVIGVLCLVSIASPQWFLLPGSWFVGAMMVWAYDKWLKKKDKV